MTLEMVHEIRLGSVRASIWREDEDGTARHSVMVSRSGSASGYRAGNRFEVDELPLVAEVMDLAHLWIFEQAELIA